MVKYGVKIPNSVKEAEQFDAEEGNTLWADAIKVEINYLLMISITLVTNLKRLPTHISQHDF